MRHIHLDPLGGIAGDMFVAALLDAAPQHAPDCLALAQSVSGVACRLVAHRDAVLTGARFTVDAPQHGHHAHVAWAEIRARLDAALSGPVRHHAMGIFAALAQAEAQVHGIAPDAVEFHEVGAADSIADIVAAAVLIAAQAVDGAAARWSVGPLPLGGGTVRTAHGVLPVPAPATALLLRGFAVMDDGIPGERVTPTGAAILAYLDAAAPPPAGPRRLLATGIGFGTRALPGRPNILRALICDTAPPATPHHDPSDHDPSDHNRRDLTVIGFEVDDQTAEDLAVALDRLRALPGVLDVLQMPALGKKGRMTAHIQLLAAPHASEAVIAACFAETTTLGLRLQPVEGRTLRRHMAEVALDGRTLRVKRAQRPGGATGKTENDDVADTAGHAARAALRAAAEAAARE